MPDSRIIKPTINEEKMPSFNETHLLFTNPLLIRINLMIAEQAYTGSCPLLIVLTKGIVNLSRILFSGEILEIFHTQ